MVSATDEFVSAFCSLEGRTIAQRKRNLFRLLNANVDSKIDFAEIRPLTLLEETFKVDVVIFFREKDEMIKLLTNENLAVIEKLLKEDWFVKHICETVSGKSLVSDIFPNVSYNTKQKLLNRLATNISDSSKADEFFYCVKESYGQYLASKLLPSCSEDVILRTLETYKVELTPKQLLLIIKRNPSMTSKVIEKLIESHPNVNTAEKYKFVFHHLMGNDPSVLLKVDDHRFTLGKRATRHFLLSNREFFLKHSQKLYKLLDKGEIGRCLPNELGRIFASIVPKSMIEFCQDFEAFLSVLDVLPTNAEKLRILLSTFDQRYGGDLLAQSDFVVPKVFEWMSPDFKRDWMEAHPKPSEMSQEQWISCMNIDVSIALLEKRISCTSNINDREKLIAALVQTCKINNDLDKLAYVCEYVFSKHRNDHVRVKTVFLQTLHRCFKLGKLKEAHWKHLSQFIQVFGSNYMSNYLTEKFIVALVHFNLKNDLPITEPLKLHAQICYGRYNILQFNPEYEKRCLETFYEVIPLCYTNEDLKHLYMQFLQCICDWNKRHPKNTMPIFTFKSAIDVFVPLLEATDYYSFANIIAVQLILQDFEKAKEANLLKLLLSKSTYSEQTLKIINLHSLSIVDNLESFVQVVLKSYMSFNTLRQCFRNVLDSETRQQVAAICKKAIREDVNVNNKKRHPLYILSFVSTHEDFISFIRQFYPTESVLNLDDPDCKLRREIPTSFRSFVKPSTALEPILHFCVGDYMQHAQRTLHRLTYACPEFEVAIALRKLSDRAVSVRKHSIVLSLALLGKTASNNVVNETKNVEKNASIRKTLFQSVLNSFLRSPDAYLWKFVEEIMKTLNLEDDVEPAKILTARLKRVSNQFYSTYVQFTWKLLDSLTATDTIVENKRSMLAEIVKEYVVMLPIDFCTDLIKAHLYTFTDGEFQDKMCLFAANYIMYSKHQNLPEIFAIIRNHLASHPKASHKLIKELCRNFIENKFANEDVYVRFVSMWNGAVNSFEALSEHIYLNLTLILCQSRQHLSVVDIGREISAYFCMLLEVKGEALKEFGTCFQFVFQKHSLSHLSGSSEENIFAIIDNIINDEYDNMCLALGLSLLPYEVKKVLKIEEIYERIVKKAAACSNPSVQIALRNHLINKL